MTDPESALQQSRSLKGEGYIHFEVTWVYTASAFITFAALSLVTLARWW